MDQFSTLTSALASRYTLDREIGEGGMATVYLARDLRHERRVALKVLKPELGAVLGLERFTTRYYGWYANRPRGMRRQAEPATDGPPAIVPAPRLAPTEATRRWAALLQQIYEVDPLACPTCHGAMRVVAFITQTSVIDQILTHLRTRAAREAHAGPRSPPSTRAPASRSTARAARPSADAPTAP